MINCLSLSLFWIIRSLPACRHLCLSIRLYVCSSVHPSNCLSAHLSTCPCVNKSICQSARLSICPTDQLSACLSVSQSTCLTALLPVWLYVCLSVHMSATFSLMNHEMPFSASENYVYLPNMIHAGFNSFFNWPLNDHHMNHPTGACATKHFKAVMNSVPQ
jgi:hypothetical protein